MTDTAERPAAAGAGGSRAEASWSVEVRTDDDALRECHAA